MKILFIDEVHPLISESFSSSGWICDLEYNTSLENLEKIIPLYNGIIIRSRIPLNETILSKATKLQFIGRPGAGLENIDVDYCKKNNIEVFRSPEGNRDAVAETRCGHAAFFI